MFVWFLFDRSHELLVTMHFKWYYSDLEIIISQVSRVVLLKRSVRGKKGCNYQFWAEDVESFYDKWERFKLLLCKCSNHNMSAMEKLTPFIYRWTKGSNWNTSRRLSWRYLKVKSVKSKGVHAFNSHTTYLSQMVVLSNT